VALLLVGLAGLAGSVMVAVLTLAGARGARVDVARSLAALERTRPSGYVAPRDRPLSQRLGAPAARRLGALGRALTPSAAIGRLQRHLDYAGNPPAWPVERVVPIKGVALAVGLVAGGALGLLFGGGAGVAFGVPLGALFGLFLPDLLVYNAGLKRQQELLRSLPDVLDTLVISVEAGLGFDAAMAQVAQNGKGPLARETVRVLQEMQIGKSRAEALRALAARTTVAELRTFVTAVVQAGELGVPIAGVLREHSREMRIRRRQRAEELAQKVPIKILFPVLFCLFPALFVVILGPGVLQIVDAFSR
jgi:tight adherence protein C